jgi:hypothetical protein
LFCLVNFWIKKQMLLNLNFIKKISQAVGAAKIVPTRHNVALAHQAPEDLLADLLHAKVVLVCRYDHLPSLVPLYDGPYRMLTRSRDFFCLQIGNRTNTVSTSRLKPCMDPAAAPVARRNKDAPWASRTMSPSTGHLCCYTCCAC